MTKYCPNCGAKMSDNAYFCMGCGVSLSDYTFQDGHNISDNVINKSQVGQSSVGNITVSPKFNQKMNTSPTCPNCNNIITENNKLILNPCQICGEKICLSCGAKYFDTGAGGQASEFKFKHISAYLRYKKLDVKIDEPFCFICVKSIIDYYNCADCSGSGKCNSCNGAKKWKCSNCKGTGKLIFGKCKWCNGRGELVCIHCSETGECPSCKGIGINKYVNIENNI